MPHPPAAPESNAAPAPANRRRLALSPSRANDYRQCPLKYRLRAIDKIPEPQTIAQVKGTLVHDVLEQMHSWPRQSRTYPNAVARLKPTWREMADKDAELDELVGEDDLLDFLIQCRALLKGYFMMENPQGFDATELEQFVTARLEGVPARGFIDRVDVAPTGEVRIVDYKTGKKPAPRFQNEALFQMRFYALVYWRITGRVPDQLRLMYLKAADDLVHVPRVPELERFQRELSQLWADIVRDGEYGDFAPKTSKLCDWCSFKDSYCPAFGHEPPEYPGWPGAA
ncbi:RecB family exonuclease [Corynebacterium sp. TAE3-ERU12]|uniref:RecB family exonuclease n=1 Tax=Corynebacterium sp. TAE3-ERU12 TaxID=2849491 RepID=UPI001C45885A|nr:RecB family exonuclease [Corynebacterium sp. TAE3-ERU12]MBV7295465.1 RecB family exonuclease [Corynebacterium sp. TAE3-ERU12]